MNGYRRYKHPIRILLDLAVQLWQLETYRTFKIVA